MQKISPEEVNAAFDAYIAAFNELAALEDELEEMRMAMEDYKENSFKHNEAKAATMAFERSLVGPQRKFRLAAIELDRAKTLANMSRG